MSISRILVIVVVGVLLVTVAFAIRQAKALSAVTPVEDHSYDTIERLRSTRGFMIPEDHSYDDIERVRSTRVK
jgi:hypothetical protein